ncbi:hypothetical protein [Nocardioides sp. REDSEA-S30_B4]|uniref:hypothetical protein n=1 Tax=Nocardioides sp. REDSEA-S30_B4 TaxID=1811552 RepID=UPI0034580B0A
MSDVSASEQAGLAGEAVGELGGVEVVAQDAGGGPAGGVEAGDGGEGREVVGVGVGEQSQVLTGRWRRVEAPLVGVAWAGVDVAAEAVQAQEVGHRVQRRARVADDVVEAHQQHPLAGQVLERAAQLDAVEAARDDGVLPRVALAPALRHLGDAGRAHPDQLAEGGVLPLPGELVGEHRPLRERPLDRVAEAQHHLHLRPTGRGEVGVVGGDPLHGPRPEEVRRCRVDRPACEPLLVGPRDGAVVGVVRRRPVAGVVVEEVPLLHPVPGDVTVPDQQRVQGAGGPLLHAAQDDADGQERRLFPSHGSRV